MHTLPFRNIAIIAHVDHGKTTLVDAMLWQSGIFRANQRVAERVMDSNDLERERGITILAKNTAVRYGGVKINIVDTPGHADFGGEVERTLQMVDGVLLLVDAAEGPLPQTRFVLAKALELGLPPIVVINKIDRPDARAARGPRRDLRPLHRPRRLRGAARLPGLLHRRPQGPVPARPRRRASPTCSLCSTRSWARCRRRTAIRRPRCSSWSPTSTGRTTSAGSRSAGSSNGTLRAGSAVGQRPRARSRARYASGPCSPTRGSSGSRSRRRWPATSWPSPGSTRSRSATRWSTLDDPRPLKRIAVDEPTIAMVFSVNTSPFGGREGQYVTARQIRDRLEKEMLYNVALRLEVARTATPSRCSAAVSCSSRS